MRACDLWLAGCRIIRLSRGYSNLWRNIRRTWKEGKTPSNRLKNANISIQPEKSELIFLKISHLGRIISSEGGKSDPEKIDAMKKFPTHKNPRNIKQFRGLTGY